MVEDILGAETGAEADFTAYKSKYDKSENAEGQLTLDVFRDGDDIIIKSAIAGVSPDEIDISITNDMVTVKGERGKDQKVKGSDYYYQELYWGRFSRSVILPMDIDPDKAKASMKNGILTIRLPVAGKSKSKKISL